MGLPPAPLGSLTITQIIQIIIQMKIMTNIIMIDITNNNGNGNYQNLKLQDTRGLPSSPPGPLKLISIISRNMKVVVVRIIIIIIIILTIIT